MRNIKIILLSIFALTSFILNAKVNVGIEVMPQFSSRLSWGAGVNLEIPLSDKLYLSPGLGYSLRHRYEESLFEHTEFSSEGDKLVSYEKASIDIKGNYISVPFLVGYKGYFGSASTIKVAGGVYYAYCMSGKSKLTMDENGSVSQMQLPSCRTIIAKRSDFGLCIEAKCLLHKHYQIGLNLQHGLIKIYEGLDVQTGYDPWTFHRLGPGVQFHQSIGLSLGYLF